MNTPRQLLYSLEDAYSRETGRMSPLCISMIGPVPDIEFASWMTFLQARFPGFTSDGCTCVPSMAAKAACQWHDLLYYLGYDRYLADLELLYWIAAIRYKSRWTRGIHTLWSRTYYYGVRAFGWIPYATHRRRGHPLEAR